MVYNDHDWYAHALKRHPDTSQRSVRSKRNNVLAMWCPTASWSDMSGADFEGEWRCVGEEDESFTFEPDEIDIVLA